MGTWHSHHQLNLTDPSAGDVNSIQEYGRRHHRKSAIEIICTIRNQVVVPIPFFYADVQNAKRTGYTPAVFEVINEESLVRKHFAFDKKVFPKVVNWRSISTNQFNLNDNILEQESISNENKSHSSLKLPHLLESEVINLTKNERHVEIDQRGDDYLVKIWLEEEKSLVFLIQYQKSELSLYLAIPRFYGQEICLQYCSSNCSGLR